MPPYDFYNEDYFTTYGGYVDPDGRPAYLRSQEHTRACASIFYEIAHPESVLDCGCACGKYVYGFYLLDPAIRTAGFDVSDFAIGHAAEEIKDRLQVLDISQPLPFGDDSFDLLIGFDILEHLVDYRSIMDAAGEMCRVAKKNILLRQPMVNLADPYRPATTPEEGKKREVEILTMLNVLPHRARLELIDVSPYITAVKPDHRRIEHPNEHPREFWIELFRSLGFVERELDERFYHFPNPPHLCSVNVLFFEAGAKE